MDSATASRRCAGCRYRTRWHRDCVTPALPPEVICQYINVEQTALDGHYRIAEAKLLAAQKPTDGRYHQCH